MFIAKVAGRVQGVGFRYETCAIAKQKHLKGYVRNLSDGSVEIAIDGTKQALQALVKDLENSFGQTQISSVSYSEQNNTEAFSDFSIRY